VKLEECILGCFLIDEEAHVKLVVRSMEKIGQFRQSSTPEAGKSYWMPFSNVGRMVKRPSRERRNRSFSCRGIGSAV